MRFDKNQSAEIFERSLKKAYDEDLNIRSMMFDFQDSSCSVRGRIEFDRNSIHSMGKELK